MSSINMSTGVSIEKLDGTNYHVWKFKMQLVLEDKELFGVIDGTDVKAEGLLTSPTHSMLWDSIECVGEISIDLWVKELSESSVHAS